MRTPSGCPPAMDKSRRSTTPGKPLTPALSANLRGAKSPLTPRLAGALTPTASPLLRKSQDSNPTTPRNGLQQERGTPASSFLNANITPRSGPRKARVDHGTPISPRTTTENTPVGVRPRSAGHRKSEEAGVGLGLGIGKARMSRPQSINDQALNSSLSNKSTSPDSRMSITSPGSSPFFHAADANSPASSVEQVQRPKSSRQSTFLYANGNEDVAQSEPNGGNVHIKHEHTQSKFFYACDASSPPLGSSEPPSDHSRSSNITSPRIVAMRPGLGTPTLPKRPSSPIKDAGITPRKTSLRKNAPPPFSSESLQTTAKKSPLLEPRDMGRRSSNVSASQITHRKTSSTNSNSSRMSYFAASVPQSPAPPTIATSEIPNLLPPTSPPISPGLSQSITFPHPFSIAGTPDLSQPVSPTKSAPSATVQPPPELPDAVADARRERKVLDLEISNSSLLAINRTLEREMRKQTAELRRYRRASRTGRFSLPMSKRRAVSEAVGLATLNENTQEGDDTITTDEEDETDDGILDHSIDGDAVSSLSEEGSDYSSPRSSTSSSITYPRNRLVDADCDLEKHQQLLVDSQKINQSIKRCMTMADLLIAEGKKALEYQVKASDVEVGGRVLGPEECEALNIEVEEGRGLLETGLEIEREIEKEAERDVERVSQAEWATDGMGEWNWKESGHEEG
ncbi:MAG: hypothetical protein M1834_003611 [Cirrosporium novae-zelandiae]|nr:MAG: hypothetical protein M1834_003611 [Cirrosporium novae-zelandiae]